MSVILLCLILIFAGVNTVGAEGPSKKIEIYVDGAKQGSLKIYRQKRLINFFQKTANDAYATQNFFDTFWMKLLEEGLRGYSDEEINFAVDAVDWPTPLNDDQRRQLLHLIEMGQMINESLRIDPNILSQIQLNKIKTVELSSQGEKEPTP